MEKIKIKLNSYQGKEPGLEIIFEEGNFFLKDTRGIREINSEEFINLGDLGLSLKCEVQLKDKKVVNYFDENYFLSNKNTKNGVENSNDPLGFLFE